MQDMSNLLFLRATPLFETNFEQRKRHLQERTALFARCVLETGTIAGASVRLGVHRQSVDRVLRESGVDIKSLTRQAKALLGQRQNKGMGNDGPRPDRL